MRASLVHGPAKIHLGDALVLTRNPSAGPGYGQQPTREMECPAVLETSVGSVNNVTLQVGQLWWLYLEVALMT